MFRNERSYCAESRIFLWDTIRLISDTLLMINELRLWWLLICFHCLSNAIHGIGQILKSLECTSVCLCVRTNLSSTIATTIFVRSSSNLVHGSHMWKRRLSSVDKFPGSMAPLLHPKNCFLGRTSSLSQWRAFQRLSWRPIKLLSQNLSSAKCKIRGQRGHGLGHVTYF